MPRSARMTVPKFVGRKGSGSPLVMLTAYDFPTARILDESGVDAILVGDSLAMVVQGHDTTLPVTLDEMIYHAKMVSRAVHQALVIVDMPFPSNHLGVHSVVEQAGRILKETQAQAVKLEGGAEQAEVIAALVRAGIPVMAHVGLRPQSIHSMGGFRVQRDEDVLLEDALAAQHAGAFGIVLECIPRSIAAKLTKQLSIPTIGIGAGPDCDGQVLVLHDLLGFRSEYSPRFVKAYADFDVQMRSAVSRYRDEVTKREFPGPEHCFE